MSGLTGRGKEVKDEKLNNDSMKRSDDFTIAMEEKDQG